MTKRGSFSLAQTRTVIRSLLFFPPEHFSPFIDNVLSGRHFQKRPVSSALEILSGLNSRSIDGNWLQFHSITMSSLTDPSSPVTFLKTMPCLFLNCSNYPLLHAKSKWPNFKANSLALTFRIGPEIGTFMCLACLNQMNKTSSISRWAVRHKRFLPWWKLVVAYDSRRWSFFFKMVEIILLGKLKYLAISVLLLVPASTASITAILVASSVTRSNTSNFPNSRKIFP